MKTTVQRSRPGIWSIWLRRSAIILVVGLIAWLALGWSGLKQEALAKTAYGARVACSCVHIAGRALDDCEADILPGFSSVIFVEDAQDKSVTARVPFLVSQTARWREGPGCLLEGWSR